MGAVQMKKFLSFFVGIMVVCSAMGANDRASVLKGVSRAYVGVARKSSLKFQDKPVGVNGVVTAESATDAVIQDQRDAERKACMFNNGWGMENTFVWASKYSDTSNYSTMVEDVEHPENNVCWVLVGLRSNDGKVNLSDVPVKYFEMGTNITCGSWVNEALVEKRILDAKKTARTLATVAGSVGGAGIGVGAMELFGNKALSNINGLKGLEGQKTLSKSELFVSNLKAYDKNDARYTNIVNMLKNLKTICDKDKTITQCNKTNYYDYDYILNELGEK